MQYIWLQINSCKHITVHDVVNTTIPAIKSTANHPTPAVTPKTVGYIHAVVIDTLTLHSTEAPYDHALIVQEDVCGELNELTSSAFQTELRDCLVDYYEKVCLMEGAGGLPSIRTNKCKFKPTARIPDVVEETSQQVDQADQADAVDIEPEAAAENGARGSPAKAAKEPDVEATPLPARGGKAAKPAAGAGRRRPGKAVE